LVVAAADERCPHQLPVAADYCVVHLSKSTESDLSAAAAAAAGITADVQVIMLFLELHAQCIIIIIIITPLDCLRIIIH
jgi:hypothetical protein